jgi:hypothetical protein
VAKRFRIAFSFAGEKRAFVARVAQTLAEHLGEHRVLYDKFHQADFARTDLAFHLPALYHDETDLIVVVLCKDYEHKEWCGLEWNAVYGLIKKRRARDVMLCRFDRAEGRGLFDLAGYLELDQMTSEDAARQILNRLASNDQESGSRDISVRSDRDWPVLAPPLEWPVADHRQAQEEFARLITRESSFRILLVHGRSETGKSHLTKQFLRNALKISGLACGRFDFKGSSDFGLELRTFADSLGVRPSPTGIDVTAQLASVFAAVKDAGRPTLLIFDSFELAGAAERWVKDNLLVAAVTAPWLRVIVVGQRVPDAHGEPWAGDASQPFELLPPSPEDWFAYGREHNRSPQFTVELLRTIHGLVGGRASVLAQICRP